MSSLSMDFKSLSSSNHCKSYSLEFDSILVDRDAAKLKHLVDWLQRHQKYCCTNDKSMCRKNQHVECEKDCTCYANVLRIFSHIQNCKFESLTVSKDKAKEASVWNSHNNGWKYSIVECPTTVLFGYLHQAETGHIYLSEEGYSILCVFSGGKNNNPLCNANLKERSNLVSITNFSFVFEHFTVNDGCTIFKEYLLIPHSNVTTLKILPCSTCRKENVENIDVQSNESKLRVDITEITIKLQDELNVSSKKQLFVCREIKVIFKSQSVLEENLNCGNIVAWVSKKKVIDLSNRKQLSCVGLITNHDTEDILSTTMANLKIDANWELCVLSFKISHQETFRRLLTGHSYHMISPFANRNSFFTHGKSKITTKNGLTYIAVMGETQFSHCNECLSENCFAHWTELLSCRASRISDIVSYKTSKNYLTQAVLIDKFFIAEKLPNGEFPSKQNLTLCLILKDTVSSDNIRLYIPQCRMDVLGLPNSLVLVFGCVGIKSQSNNMYLRSSSLFDIHVLEYGCSPTFKGMRTICDLQPTFLKAVVSTNPPPVSFVCHGFLLKIISARIFLACTTCVQGTESCLKSHNRMVKAEISFQVDDGSSAISLNCSGNQVKSLLKLTQEEWNAFVNYIKMKKRSLDFCISENPDDINATVHQLFHLSCTRHCLQRHLSLHCSSRWIAGDRNTLKQNFICISFSELQAVDILTHLN